MSAPVPRPLSASSVSRYHHALREAQDAVGFLNAERKLMEAFAEEHAVLSATPEAERDDAFIEARAAESPLPDAIDEWVRQITRVRSAISRAERRKLES